MRDWWIISFHILVFAASLGFTANALGLLSKTLEGRALHVSRIAWVSRLLGFWEGFPAGLITSLLGFTCSFMVLEWDRNLRYNVDKDGYAILAEGQRLSAWRLVGMQLERALDRIGIRTFSSLDFEDISVKPATWTGLAQNSETELGLTRGARLTHGSLRKVKAYRTFFCNSSLGPMDMNFAYFPYTDFRGTSFFLVSAQSTNFNGANSRTTCPRSEK